MNTRTEHHRVLVATNDKALPKLLMAILAPVGFSLLTVPAEQASAVESEGFTLYVIDGDPHISLDSIGAAVVVISPTDAIKMYDEGADLVLNRPLVANVFMAKIRAVLRRYGVRV